MRDVSAVRQSGMDESMHRAVSSGRLALGLVGGGVLLLTAAGALLWWRLGGAVFNDLVLSGLAWCF